MSSPDPPTVYDEVLYPAHPFPQTHPGALAALAHLHGLPSPPPSRCRVLELGCGGAGNLVPLAYSFPGSEFTGIDLSATLIEAGRRMAAPLGLSNLTLLHGDIMDVGPDSGEFDYIVAHGVYSWVPPFVRDKIMAILRDHLSPDGVALISFNCKPGSHLRDYARDVMRFHVAAMLQPEEKIAQARGILGFVTDAAPQQLVHGKLLREELERVRTVPDPVLFHDDLSPNAAAFLLHEVADLAESHGLQFLSDTTLSDPALRGHSPQTVGLLAGFPPERVVRREQYLDFIECRTFRNTLFCREGARLVRPVDPGRLLGFHLASSLRPKPGQAGSRTSFVADNGETLEAESRFVVQALERLAAAWPATLPGAELVRDAGDRDSAALAGLLYRGLVREAVEIHVEPLPLTSKISARPDASRLAREQAQSGPLVTNLRLEAVLLEDQEMRRFVQLLDGTRGHDDLLRDWSVAAGRRSGSQPPLTPEAVANCLGIAAKLGLLRS